MSVIWRRPNGERVTLSALADFSGALEEIEAEITKAGQEGRYTDVALLNADHEQIFSRWRASRRVELQNDEVHLERTLDLLAKRLAWWQELAAVDEYDRPLEVSKAQAAIFSAGKMSPASWDEAKAAIAWMPEFRVPDGVDLAAAIADLERLLEAGLRLEPLMEEYISQLSDETFTADRWAEFRKKRWKLFTQAARTYNEIAERIDG